MANEYIKTLYIGQKKGGMDVDRNDLQLSGSLTRNCRVRPKNVNFNISRGFLSFVILQLLEAKQMRQKQIVRNMRALFGISMQASANNVLKNLSAHGYVTSTAAENDEDQVYNLTGKGLRFLGFEASSTIVCARALRPIVAADCDPSYQ